MQLAAKAAKQNGKPWILDPVGAGATPFRTKVIVTHRCHRWLSSFTRDGPQDTSKMLVLHWTAIDRLAAVFLHPEQLPLHPANIQAFRASQKSSCMEGCTWHADGYPAFEFKPTKVLNIVLRAVIGSCLPSKMPQIYSPGCEISQSGVGSGCR